jgi:hypothetical protein
MICTDCNHNKHAACKKRNKKKEGKDCDCQHRIRVIKIEKGSTNGGKPVSN